MGAIGEVFDAASAIAAIAVAGFTGVTLWEMAEQRREAAKPVIIAVGPSSLDSNERHIVTKIENLGTGPAFNVSVTLSHPHLKSAVAGINRIDAAQDAGVNLMYPEFANALFLFPLDHQSLSGNGSIRVVYGDVYGRTWISLTPVMLEFEAISDEFVRRNWNAKPDDVVWHIKLRGFGNPRISRNRRLVGKFVR